MTHIKALIHRLRHYQEQAAKVMAPPQRADLLRKRLRAAELLQATLSLLSHMVSEEYAYTRIVDNVSCLIEAIRSGESKCARVYLAHIESDVPDLEDCLPKSVGHATEMGDG